MEGKEVSATSLPMRHTKIDVAASSSSSNSSTNLEASDTKRSVYSKCVTGVDLVNHVLIVSLTLFTLYHSLSPINVLNLHATLCTIGYVLLMSEAIFVLAGESILTNFLTHRAKKHVHWILQALGLICTITGIVLMYRVKRIHFKSTHAILGITSACLMVFLSLFGYPVFIAAKLRNIVRPIVIKCSHNFLGLSCFAIGMASQCYGYRKFRVINFSSEVDVREICVIVTSVITVLSARSAFPSLVRQFVTLFRR